MEPIMKKQPTFHRWMTAAGVVLALCVGAAAVHAQETSSTAPSYAARIGFVNTDRLFAETRPAQAAQAKIKREFAKRESELNEMGSRLKMAIEQFEKDVAKLNDAQRAQRQALLLEQDANFQQKRREFQEDLNNRKNEELQHLLDTANRVVVQIAKDNQIDVVLQEVVYINRRLDITDKVIEVLNQQK